MSGQKRVLCYGDSNTWGYIPGTGGRFPQEIRWTGIAQRELGQGYQILEAGLNGRSTVFEDPFEPFRCGVAGLGYALLEAAPIDLLVLSLGTNDLKFTGSAGAARGVATLITQARQVWTEAKLSVRTPILVFAPILLHPDIWEIDPWPWSGFAQSYEKSLDFWRTYRQMADEFHVHLLNAAEYADPSAVDGIHMEAESHLRLGRAAAEAIRQILPEALAAAE